MATALAAIALAISFSVIFIAVAVIQRQRNALTADFRKAVADAERTFRGQIAQVTVSRENHDEAVETYRKIRDRAQAHFLTADSDASRTGRRLDELERYTIRTLEHQAATGSKPLILRGSLYVQQLPVLDIVLDLVDRFLLALGADLMYRQDDGADGSMFYLRWLIDKAPRDVLDSLTRAVAAPCSFCGNSWNSCSGSTSGCPGRSNPAPTGATELQAVLQALRDGGLGVLCLGPLILLRTKACIQAGFLLPGFQWLTEDQKKDAVNPDRPNLMSQLGVAVFLEFKQ